MDHALLTRGELDWLAGKSQGISKSFEYKLKSTLRKKIRTFLDTELPLLVKNDLFSFINEFPYHFADYYGEKERQASMRFRDETLPNETSSLGKAKVPEKNVKGAAKGLLSYFPKQSKGRDTGVVQSYEVIIDKRL
jgi:hypothetical protein